MRKRHRPGLRAILGVLCAALAVLLIGLCTQFSRVRALETQVNAAYEKAFYETTELMSGIQSNLEKMMVTASASQEQILLSGIARQADSAQDNLAMLPATLPSVVGSLKFVNQLGDFCRTLGERLSAGGAVSAADQETLATLYAYSIETGGMLDAVAREMEAGAAPLSQASAAENRPSETDAEDKNESQEIDYPELLYDGPFSDGRSTDSLLALEGRSQIDEAEALEIARRFIGEARVRSIVKTGEGQTPVPVYELSAVTDDGTLSLAVTRQGGAVLYMLLDGVVAEEKYSRADCVDLAALFLRNSGYADMEIRYWAEYAGLVTVNFAPVEREVVLYPDLVKVQISRATGLPVGFEALNFLSSHVPRQNLTPTLSADAARQRLNGYLDVLRERLALIPADDGEHLCYEFSVALGEAEYLIYIDAHTGLERKIYRLLEDENGQLVI